MIIRSAIMGISIGLYSVAAAPFAAAQCDISQTKCALNGGKCNIKFKNRTGDSGGSDGGTSLQQNSASQAIQVKARKSNGDKAGNKLVIQLEASKTMNIDKKAKKDFQDIRLSSDNAPAMYKSSTMSCQDIVAVLNGNGTCKVFHGTLKEGEEVKGLLGYQCDGGNVAGPVSKD